MKYSDFLKTKKERIQYSGIEISEDALNSHLFPFQKHITKIALKLGRYAIFADCGLGKTIMQLEWAHQVVVHTGKSVIILAPLAVSAQTLLEAYKFGIPASEFNHQHKPGVYITNYEQIEHVDSDDFAGIVLDESSILKNFSGKIRTKLIDKFKMTEYKLCCTATPSPNDPMELGNHSEFLCHMSRNEMLAMFFVHDGGSTQNWRIKRHAMDKFYEYISKWAVMMSKPGDIGYNNEGYDLSDLTYIDHLVSTQYRDNGMLFNEVAVSATNFNAELRSTQSARVDVAADIANSSDDQYLIWVKHNKESAIMTKRINGAIEVKGSDSAEVKTERLLGFASGKYRCLVTKTKIAQFGMNFQNCHNQIFASLDFSFESLYQAVRRSYRFGQDNEVNIHLITTDTMQNVKTSIERKEIEFARMQQQMITYQKHEINV